MEDDYGPIRGARDVWAFTEHTPRDRAICRKDTTTDADIQRIMARRTPTLPLSAEVRAAARARADQLPH
jgi:hypothetical protein